MLILAACTTLAIGGNTAEDSACLANGDAPADFPAFQCWANEDKKGCLAAIVNNKQNMCVWLGFADDRSTVTATTTTAKAKDTTASTTSTSTSTTSTTTANPDIPEGFKPSLNIKDGNINIDAREVRVRLQSGSETALSQLLADVAALKTGQADLKAATDVFDASLKDWHTAVTANNAALADLDEAAAALSTQIDDASDDAYKTSVHVKDLEGDIRQAAENKKAVLTPAYDEAIGAVQKIVGTAGSSAASVAQVLEANFEPTSKYVGRNYGSYKKAFRKEETVTLFEKKWASVGAAKGQTPRVMENIARGRYLIKWNGK